MDWSRDEEIEHEYQGRTWKLPRRLAQLQAAITTADTECRRDDVHPDELAAARAKRLELILEKYLLARAWWDGFEKYEQWHADWALQDFARTRAEPPPSERSVH